MRRTASILPRPGSGGELDVYPSDHGSCIRSFRGGSAAITKRRISILALLAALVFCGFALADSPTNGQYGGPGEEHGGPPSTEQPQGPPRLPFTGFQAGILLLAGAGAVTAGLMLRSARAGEPEPPAPVLPDWAETDRELPFLAMPLERCECCGKPLSSLGFRIMKNGRSYDSVECARAQRRAFGPDLALFARA